MSREWQRKIAYGAHLLSEWTPKHFVDIVYQSEDMPPINLQHPPEWWIPGEKSRRGPDDVAKEGV